MMHPPNVLVGTTDGGSRHYLTILASSAYNGTAVQCFAVVRNNEQLVTVESPSVLLIVQGKRTLICMDQHVIVSLDVYYSVYFNLIIISDDLASGQSL